MQFPNPMNEIPSAADMEPITLEHALGRLEQITRELESGELELATSLELYEEGVRLMRVADELLSRAESRIEQLRADGEGFRVEPFDGEGGLE